MSRSHLALPLTLLSLATVAAGCGSNSKTSSSAPAAASSPRMTTSATTALAPASGAGALTAEAHAAAAGDIPDNQVFLSFRDAPAGYSIRFPEGWLQHGSGRNVTFQDKNNRIRVVVSAGTPFSAAAVTADIGSLKAATASLRASAPKPLTLPAGAAFKVAYSTVSSADPVTNKRVTLTVDRYYLSMAGKRAIVDLGAPKGVDNVDAYRRIIQSFRWK